MGRVPPLPGREEPAARIPRPPTADESRPLRPADQPRDQAAGRATSMGICRDVLVWYSAYEG